LAELEAWFGGAVREWRHLRTYRIERALPRQAPGTGFTGAGFRKEAGIYVCGDHLYPLPIADCTARMTTFDSTPSLPNDAQRLAVRVRPARDAVMYQHCSIPARPMGFGAARFSTNPIRCAAQV
jgi:hypothetical protein